MKCLLLAAGFGRRLRPMTDLLPKCLVPIHGRPLILYWLRLLEDAGIEEVVINLHFHAERVRRLLETVPSRMRIRLAYEAELLGTGGTLLSNREFLAGDPVMVIHADNLAIFDVSRFIERHRQRSTLADMTMLVFRTPQPESCGIVETDGHDIVQSFHEKTLRVHGNLANGAVYIFEPEIFDDLLTMQKSVIDLSTEVIPARVGRIQTFGPGLYHRDIGTIESFLAAQGDYAGPRPFGSRWLEKCGLAQSEFAARFLENLKSGHPDLQILVVANDTDLHSIKDADATHIAVVERASGHFRPDAFYRETGILPIVLEAEI